MNVQSSIGGLDLKGANAKRLLYPVGVETAQTRINVKRCESLDFDKIEKHSLDRIKFLKTEIDRAGKRDSQQPLIPLSSHEVGSRTGASAGPLVTLSDETKFSFTIPPNAPPLLHIRFRINVDSKKGEWLNPLTWKDGSFFSPKMKVKLKSSPHMKRQSVASQDYVYRNPPPVIMSRSWERKNIVGLYKWQDQVVNPVEGELRIYTITGLTPSVEKGDTWSNWVFSSAGQGLYGTRTIEVQFASEVYERPYERRSKEKRSNGISKLRRTGSIEFQDALSNSLSDSDSEREFIEHEAIRNWEEVEESDWKVMQPLKYVVPSTDLFTTLLFIALNWGKSVGVKQMEEALIGQLDTNRARNTQVLKDFIGEVMIKLEPVWENTIVPWLEKNPNLHFILKEKRDEKIREKALEVMEILKEQSLIQDIPGDFLSIRPSINGVTVSVLDGNDQVSQTITISSTEGTVDTYDVPEGVRFRVGGKAQVSKFYRDHVADAVNAIRVLEHRPELKIWWVLLNESTGRYVEFSDGILMDTESFIIGPSKKIRKSEAKQPPLQDADTNQLKAFESSIEFNGLDRYGGILLESPTVLSIKIIAEEYGAHEDDIKEIRIHFTSPLRASPSDTSLSSLVDADSGRGNRIKRQASIDEIGKLPSLNPEAPVRRSPPSVFGGVETDDEIHDVFERLRVAYSEGIQTVEKTTVDEHMNDRWIIRSILEQLGHEPTEYDIEEAVTRLSKIVPEEKSILESEDSFIVWYKTTTFCKSMLVYTLDQLRETAIQKRNAFLEDKLKIPRNEWGFNPSEWGGFIPNGSFFVKHASGLAKWYMSDTWKKQLYRSTGMASPKVETENEEDESRTNMVTSAIESIPVDLLDHTQVDEEAFTTILITFLKSMARERLSHTLPDSVFENEELRRQWIQDGLSKNIPLDSTLQEIVAWKMIDYYTKFKTNKPMRMESKKENEDKQKRVLDILNSPSSRKMYFERNFNAQITAESADIDIDDITLLDMANVIGKDIVRHEVEMLIADLLPLLTTTVSEHIFPAIVQGISDYFLRLVQKNKFKLVALSIACVGFYGRKNLALIYDDIFRA
uniref:Uncharacterized protein n=1 Tax=Aplanochytrium stocchinoi TaxID=215587 RepID=A0A7S3PDM4_9STRA